MRMVGVDHEAHDDFYTVISNGLLWLVQHGLYGLATAPCITQRQRDAYENGYVAVNEAGPVVASTRRGMYHAEAPLRAPRA